MRGSVRCSRNRRGLTNHDVCISLSSCLLLSGMMNLSGGVLHFHIYRNMTCWARLMTVISTMEQLMKLQHASFSILYFDYKIPLSSTF